VAGIGCHYMTTWMPDRRTSTFTQMGGEGVTWVGQAPFTKEAHVFANLGDGTYFHSGLLAIRQSIAAGTNITYKVLYNDAVAMTGGQRVGERPEGHSVLQIMNSLLSEGVGKLVIVTDEPEKYDGVKLGEGVTVHHRDELDAIQREFRELKGCTAIIYDQTCATEKRRRRKRGTLATPDKTVVINELVCEGCGDCSVQSNCLSVEPVETEFGRKRRINQNSCNKDYSCVKGFCPSFVTVEGGQLKKPKQEKKGSLEALPHSRARAARGRAGLGHRGGRRRRHGRDHHRFAAGHGRAPGRQGRGHAGCGGSGAKGGSTWSHIQIANRADAIYTTKVDMAKADLVIGCDPIVAATPTTLSVMQPGAPMWRSTAMPRPRPPLWATPTGSRLPHAAPRRWPRPWAWRPGQLRRREGLHGLLGDSIYANPMMLGYAWQKGRVPLSHASLMRAMELNGVQVARNQEAFEWGRRCAHDLEAVRALYQASQVIQFVKKPSLEEMLDKRVEFLTAYQNAAYAQQYRDFVAKVRAAEEPLAQGTRLSQAVARYLFKLMAYKDEYEVARLHTEAAFTQKISDMFEGDYKLVHHLAPPVLPRRTSRAICSKVLWPLDAQGHGLAGRHEGPARHGARSLRPHRGAPHRARPDRRIPPVHRNPADGLDGRQAGAGRGDRLHPRRHSRLRPCEGAPSGGRAHQVAVADDSLEWLGSRCASSQADGSELIAPRRITTRPGQPGLCIHGQRRCWRGLSDLIAASACIE
jgi:indolepyruvate ferredoxin oxidoreductase